MKQTATALPWCPRSGSVTRVLAGEHFLLIGDLSRICSSWKHNFKIIIWMSQSSGPGSFFLKTYTVLVSIAGPFSPLNTFSGIMALQKRNEVNNYEHYKCGEKIWTEIWRKSGALYLASSATWLHLHLCWNALTGFGVCLYQYDRYRLSYGMAFGLVVIFISSLNAQKMTNAIFRGKVLWYWGQQKRRMNLMQMLIALIGVCAAAMLLWYVYILMKGDDQAWALWFSMFYTLPFWLFWQFRWAHT